LKQISLSLDHPATFQIQNQSIDHPGSRKTCCPPLPFLQCS